MPLAAAANRHRALQLRQRRAQGIGAQQVQVGNGDGRMGRLDPSVEAPPAGGVLRQPFEARRPSVLFAQDKWLRRALGAGLLGAAHYGPQRLGGVPHLARYRIGFFAQREGSRRLEQSHGVEVVLLPGS